MNQRSGSYRNNLSGHLAYQSFLPSNLPPEPPLVLNEEAIELLATANRLIGKLDGISGSIPNVELFISMYVRKEALLSSQIEGTQATLDDILDPHVEENTNQNVADVINYIKASQYGINRLSELPLCNRLLKEIHEILMSGVRGNEKNPGEFRRSQNWIGPAGSTLQNARFIPPNTEDMENAMSELEQFINRDDVMDPLIKAALIHYQFETIHPFLDGNGRIGRLLIILFLMEKKMLSHEVLYISYFLKRNRTEYYDRLMEVRNKGNFEQWVQFFLQAVLESARDAIETVEAINQLHERSVRMLPVSGRATKTIERVLYYVESRPIIDIKKTSEDLDLSFNTIANAVKKLVEVGILKPVNQVKKGRIFAYEAYLNILRKDT